MNIVTKTAGQGPLFGCVQPWRHQISPTLRIEMSDKGPVAVGMTRQGALIAMPVVSRDQFESLVNSRPQETEAPKKSLFSLKNLALAAIIGTGLYLFRNQIGGWLNSAKRLLNPDPVNTPGSATPK